MKNLNSQKEVNNIGVFIQMVLGVAIVIMMIISIFTNLLYTQLQILIIPELLIMAYNNQKLYKRKYMTIIYIALSLYILVSLIVGML